MRGEHAGQPVRRLVARQADEGFLQFHRGLRVVAGAHHVVDAVMVGLQFVFAAEAQPDQRRPALRGEVHQAGVLAVGGQRADQRRAGRQQRALLDRLCAMPGGGMDDFMRQHRRQFRLALQFREQPAIDRQLAAGQCPGIGHRIVDDDEFEGQVGPVADLDQLLPDLIDVGRQRRIEDEPAARRLLGMQILLFAEPDFLLLGDEADFALFRHRVGGTTRRQQDERQGGSEAAEAGRNAHFHGHPNNGLTRPAVDRRSAAVRKGYRPRRCRGPDFFPYLRARPAAPG